MKNPKVILVASILFLGALAGGSILIPRGPDDVEAVLSSETADIAVRFTASAEEAGIRLGEAANDYYKYSGYPLDDRINPEIQFSEPDFNGYIIEFEDEPIIVKKNKLEKIAK